MVYYSILNHAAEQQVTVVISKEEAALSYVQRTAMPN